MSQTERDRAVRNAGAFLGPDLLVPVPMSTLDREYRDAPAEPPDDREPEPEPPGVLRRWRDRLAGLVAPRR